MSKIPVVPEDSAIVKCIRVRIRPRAWHPLYSQMEWGWLAIWLCAPPDEDEGHTVDRACSIAEQMMFDVRDELGADIIDDWSKIDGAETQEFRARTLGVGFAILGCGVGVEEPQAEDFGETDGPSAS